MGLPLKTETGLSAEEFMAWYDMQPDGKRYELLDGAVYEMMGEALIHVRTKMEVAVSLREQIFRNKMACEALVDGMAVKIDAKTVFEPDVLVRCGPLLPGDTVLLHDPVIVVEIVSPSSQRIDTYQKFMRYFNNSAIIHYLILFPAKKTAIHHQRMASGRIETQGYESGVIRLEPPGLELDLAEVMGE